MTTNNRDWYIRMALMEREIGETHGAGPFQFGVEAQRLLATPQASETHGVFGRFVQLMRRKRGLTVERLALDADIDMAELVEIEDDVAARPDPRTVYQLAQFFNVSINNLLQVAGLAEARNDLVMEGVRFAARSNPVNELTAEERAALEAFVAVLGK